MWDKLLTTFHMRAGRWRWSTKQRKNYSLLHFSSNKHRRKLSYEISPRGILQLHEIFICNHMDSWIIHFSMHMWLSLSSKFLPHISTSCKKESFPPQLEKLILSTSDPLSLHTHNEHAEWKRRKDWRRHEEEVWAAEKPMSQLLDKFSGKQIKKFIFVLEMNFPHSLSSVWLIFQREWGGKMFISKMEIVYEKLQSWVIFWCDLNWLRNFCWN